MKSKRDIVLSIILIIAVIVTFYAHFVPAMNTLFLDGAKPMGILTPIIFSLNLTLGLGFGTAMMLTMIPKAVEEHKFSLALTPNVIFVVYMMYKFDVIVSMMLTDNSIVSNFNLFESVLIFSTWVYVYVCILFTIMILHGIGRKNENRK